MNILDYFFEAAVSIPLGPTVLVVLVVLIGVVGVLLAMVFRLSSRVRDFMYPAYDQIVKKAERDAEGILREAREHARNVKVRAELEAGTILAEHKREGEALHAKLVTELENVAAGGKELLSKEAETIRTFSTDATARFKQSAAAAETALKEETETLRRVMSEARGELARSLELLSERTEKEKESLEALTKKELATALDGEIKEVRRAIAAYKSERLLLVDKEIVSMVEEVSHMVLNRALSLDEHTELILDALREAKKHGSFTP